MTQTLGVLQLSKEKAQSVSPETALSGQTGFSSPDREYKLSHVADITRKFFGFVSRNYQIHRIAILEPYLCEKLTATSQPLLCSFKNKLSQGRMLS